MRENSTGKIALVKNGILIEFDLPTRVALIEANGEVGYLADFTKKEFGKFRFRERWVPLFITRVKIK